MTEAEAKALVARGRQRMRSTAPDAVVARRTQRLCLILGVIYVAVGLGFMTVVGPGPGRYWGGGGFLVVSALFFWNSRRFGLAARLLKDS